MYPHKVLKIPIMLKEIFQSYIFLYHASRLVQLSFYNTGLYNEVFLYSAQENKKKIGAAYL